jgi:hypothetical protein
LSRLAHLGLNSTERLKETIEAALSSKWYFYRTDEVKKTSRKSVAPLDCVTGNVNCIAGVESTELEQEHRDRKRIIEV